MSPLYLTLNSVICLGASTQSPQLYGSGPVFAKATWCAHSSSMFPLCLCFGKQKPVVEFPPSLNSALLPECGVRSPLSGCIGTLKLQHFPLVAKFGPFLPVSCLRAPNRAISPVISKALMLQHSLA